ncbi:hypothetical protein A167_01703 [Alcanivorax sp. S71-1-4]|uniref:DUF1499 domain-containing protein n=1 Tax=Alcanivorax sp. S71-1-4 TaxID=1177159 RepID=UPI00135CE458|nr:DUF1499 domain-containing protein [Alcanivorax sp. S71-1-4]KAF0809420.1 hypothetical protein A167_01703 [Alcanivorax sp. S71-1-4]
MPFKARLTVLLLCTAWFSTAVAEPLLPPCPDSPNCVSSLADDERAVPALKAGDTLESARAALTTLLDNLPRVTWTQPDERRLQATFTTRLLRFTDDVDFYLHDDGRVEVRSASRVGYYDFGANRRRVNALRNALPTQTGPAQAP